ncbi:MAG TPA: BTAD domain-containing putative transcriptional regulator [Pseudonocardia sp.]|jgi:predicted ATPase/DNA-binding SARP family transcriptional activator
MLDLRMLGPMEALVDDRPVALGPPQQRALLAALALRPGSVLGVDALVEALWADRSPGSATNILQGYVARLRSVLEPHRGRGQPASVLVTRAPGYLLAVSAEQTDAGRFRRLVCDARRARERDPADAASTLRAALALCRGDVLADLGDIPVAVSARALFAELRRTALAERIDADLAAGRDAELVGELEGLVAEDPLGERGHRQLMLALYRAGRPADALAAFARARRTLAEQLGLDPGPELRGLEAAILRHDVPPPEGRAPAVSPSAAPPPDRPRPDWQRSDRQRSDRQRSDRSPSRDGSPRDRRGALPAALTPFVGREAELAELRALLYEQRLVTLTGPGGAGKTRLAVELVTGGEPVGEVHLVDLLPVPDDASVPAALAAALGIREEQGRPLPETLGDSLRGERVVVLLDNCEHLLDGCAALADTLLRAAPLLRVLATSRQALGVPGEVVWPVAGLAEDAAVRLFADRAAEPFRLSPEAVPVVRRICRRLDGMPLAIELAAVRTRALSAREIEVRLDDRFGLWASGRRGGPARHRTLSAVIDWSYRLLTGAEQVLFERLSVFAGGFGLPAVEAVGGAGAVDVLAELVDKSLVVRTEGIQGRSRYRLLDTLRQYAGARLDERGGTAEALAGHAAHYAALGDRLTPLVAAPAPARWSDRLEEEGSNLRAAASWSLAEDDGSAAATIMGATWWLWLMRGPLAEGRDLLEAALRVTADPTPPTRARLLYGVASFALTQGDLVRAEQVGSECRAMSRAQGDDLGAGWGVGSMGLAAWARGDYRTGALLNEQVVELARRSGDRWHEALGLAGLGRVAADQGAHERARALLTESASLAAEIGQPQAVGFALGTLATLAYRQGRDDEAVDVAEQAMRAYRESGSQEGAGSAMRTIGLVALRRGAVEQAAALHRDRLVLYRRHGLTGPLAACLEDIAEVALHRGRPARAARLLGAADMLRATHGTAMPSADRDRHGRLVAALRVGLAGPDFDAAWADGRSMTLDSALRHAEAAAGPGVDTRQPGGEESRVWTGTVAGMRDIRSGPGAPDG